MSGMLLWRIHTEKKNFSSIVIAANTYLHDAGYSILTGTGAWKGKPEESLVIEFIGTWQDEARVKSLAHTIKICNKQDTVLVTSTKLLEHIYI
jgi:hypothetical protein